MTRAGRAFAWIRLGVGARIPPQPVSRGVHLLRPRSSHTPHRVSCFYQVRALQESEPRSRHLRSSASQNSRVSARPRCVDTPLPRISSRPLPSRIELRRGSRVELQHARGVQILGPLWFPCVSRLPGIRPAHQIRCPCGRARVLPSSCEHALRLTGRDLVRVSSPVAGERVSPEWKAGW